ncbi:MAG: dihydroceramide fatty acyl 2-hydroxylase [Solirubrobacteraceae bacterium]|jgi:sterol desaturase/sphingolipid hydroxylase (fatty acid hydroxylase superfamily)|nr:dihydroceramide fatty acyl 2-hydroxylase [Solirubrobacteraceae bacterium]
MESSSIKRTDLLSASPRMFENRLLDALSRVHPMVPPLIFVPTIVISFATAAGRVGLGDTLLALVAGYFVWSLTEYWLHRLVFHFEPEGGFGARLHWIIHGVHHDHPNDPMRLVMPPSVSVPLASGFLGLFTLALGFDWGLAMFTGFISGYLVYDMLHFHTHHHVPKTRLGRKLRELHMRHHFQDDQTGYGVSAPYWDIVFGTASSRRRTQ